MLVVSFTFQPLHLLGKEPPGPTGQTSSLQPGVREDILGGMRTQLGQN
jgi:hypothetical protein